MKEEYYRRMAQKAQDESTCYKNEVHKFILIRHSEGAKIKTIVKELIEKGTPRARDSIRYIIRRYQMLWGFKSYGPKELHMKKLGNE